ISDRAEVLRVALALALRLGERVAHDLLGRVLPQLQELPDPLEQMGLLKVALFAAADCRQVELAREFVTVLHGLLGSQSGTMLVSTQYPLVRQSIQTLRQLGLGSELGPLLSRLEELILGDEGLTALCNRLQELPHEARDQANWSTP